MEIEKEVKKVSVEPAGRRPDKGAPTVGQVTGQSCAASGPRRGPARFGSVRLWLRRGCVVLLHKCVLLKVLEYLDKVLNDRRLFTS